MQTFLPYPDIYRSVQCLDFRRLGKQRAESRQILDVLSPSYSKRGWRNHPAVRMWRHRTNVLVHYMNECITEWIRRGYNNTMERRTIYGPLIYPPWFGTEEFHASHRAALLYKDYDYYKRFGWKEKPEIAYIWPAEAEPLCEELMPGEAI